MRLINYDLHDLYALIVFFRTRPERFSEYKPALQALTEYIESNDNNIDTGHNNVRHILRPYLKSEDELLSWVLTDNIYTANIFLIKTGVVYDILAAVLREMIGNHDDPERFALLCDAVHNIPLILADEVKPKRSVETAVKQYRNRYNMLFLKKELSAL